MDYLFPLPILQNVSAAAPWTYLVFALIGFGFGYVLESSGFGNSKKLAAQFYFTELTVLKVMFGAIVTAMVLLFTMIGLGILDYNQIWVNPTYLWSGILGGLIMGVGFIVGGFCPGTSLVAMATRKIDGVFFVLGGLFGIFLFGETEPLYDLWWQTSGYLGRLTIQDWLGLPTGVVVTLVIFMALFMFWGSEQLERIFGKRDLSQEPKLRIVGAAALAALAIGTILIGDATTEEKWTRLEPVKAPLLAERAVQVSPGEVLTNMEDNQVKAIILDVRPENEYNLFHIVGAINLPLSQLKAAIPGMIATHAGNTAYFVVSNDEDLATEAWKILVAESLPNVYIIEGGINNWIATFDAEETEIQPVAISNGIDVLRFSFPAALGSRYQCADPNPHAFHFEYEPKVKLELKRDKSGGGCG
jgi:rhodanese-related sulfurtransferase